MKNVNRLQGTFVKLSKAILLIAFSAGSMLVAAEEKKVDAKDDAAKKAEDQKFEARTREIQESAMKAMYVEFEKGARLLQKEFPKRPETYELLLEVANKAEGEKAAQMAQEIVDSPVAEDGVKQAAKGLLKKIGAVGKPVNIKFTAIDGREIDISKMKGKVILVDFWATWCRPCVAELPSVIAAYEKLHGKGFEIVGISFDKKKEDLEKMVKDKKMAWPQYFDGKFWENNIGKEFGINSIPTMWLIDKQGNLRDTEGRTNLEDKVEKLLAEK